MNRDNAGRGGHVNLKRAERARVTINKIPGIFHHSHYFVEGIISHSSVGCYSAAMVDNLIKKTLVWEEETQKSFLYDGVSYHSFKVTLTQLKSFL